MTDAVSHYQQRLDGYLQERLVLIEEFSRLKNGDDFGISSSADPNKELVLSGPKRLAQMMDNRAIRIAKIDAKISDYCRITGLENPIPKTRPL